MADAGSVSFMIWREVVRPLKPRRPVRGRRVKGDGMEKKMDLERRGHLWRIEIRLREGGMLESYG